MGDEQHPAELWAGGVEGGDPGLAEPGGHDDEAGGVALGAGGFEGVECVSLDGPRLDGLDGRLGGDAEVDDLAGPGLPRLAVGAQEVVVEGSRPKPLTAPPCGSADGSCRRSPFPAMLVPARGRKPLRRHPSARSPPVRRPTSKWKLTVGSCHTRTSSEPGWVAAVSAMSSRRARASASVTARWSVVSTLMAAPRSMASASWPASWARPDFMMKLTTRSMRSSRSLRRQRMSSSSRRRSAMPSKSSAGGTMAAGAWSSPRSGGPGGDAAR